MIEKVISGGQTGVDRAALDVALALGIPCGGWCPQGRRAEDGTIPGHYPLRETRSARYAVRTERNVRDSDGTLIVTRGRLMGGTALTFELARRMGKPCLVIDLEARPDVGQAREWLEWHGVRILNVAGPRKSTRPGIYGQAARFLHTLLAYT